ncbi:MAG: transcriptional regulator [Ktedonobacteraceae bacterium]|nr:transcriptional regulator [Ktedonobacteraceae bacterium]
MPQVISLRIPDATAERLRTTARRAGRTLNEWGALSLEEWLRQNEFADIEFRSVGGERQACLKGALPIWQIILVAQSYGMDTERTAEHFAWPRRRAQAALNYYEAFPAEIDQAIEDNHAMTETALKRLLPQMETLVVPGSDYAENQNRKVDENVESIGKKGSDGDKETASLS